MDLTVERLTRLLGRPVESFVTQPVGLFTSKVSRLTVTMADTPEPRRLILKEPNPDRRGDRLGESFALEARFYSEIAPHLTIRVPGCLGAQDSHIILEDVAHQPFSWKRGATEHHARAVMDGLRALHQVEAANSCTWVPDFSDEDFRDALGRRCSESWARNRTALCRWCPGFAAVGDHLTSRMADYYAVLTSQNTLLHGDAHLENIPLLDPGAKAHNGRNHEVVFFDWQGPRRGHPLFDVAYFTVMSFPPHVRRAWERSLLQQYLGHPPDRHESTLYRYGVAARASAVVEMTAGWSSAQLSDPGFGWVADRCFSAAIEHRVHELAN